MSKDHGEVAAAPERKNWSAGDLARVGLGQCLGASVAFGAAAGG